ncbi:MAG: ATP-binding protein [Anaerolineae bacterium]
MRAKPARLFSGWRGRLLASFALVIGLSIGLVALGVQSLAVPRLEDIARLAAQRHAARLAPFLVQSYRHSGSWQAAAALVNSTASPEIPPGAVSYFPQRDALLAAFAADRLLLADAAGRVAADSRGVLLPGEPLPADLRAQAIPLRDGETVIGYLLVEAGFEQAVAQVVLTLQRRTLLGAALLAALVALPVSGWLAFRLAGPLQRLNRAARQLTAGESADPLPVESADEIGELTGSFNRMSAALQEQKRLRRQMVADIAHELRTPISVMRLELEGMADGLQSPAETAASLGDELETLNRLVEELRLLSLADAGGLQFELSPLEAAPFLRQLADSWQPQARVRQVRLESDIAAPLPPLLADRERLAQLVGNLLSNALRHTPPGGQVTLGARPEGDSLRLWVADSGPGLAPADLPHLFERFYRADSSRSRDTGGSGLGLAIARQWAALHGGRIWAENRPEGGALFVVELPAAPHPAD